jgi:zinc transport system substrate-binding protein
MTVAVADFPSAWLTERVGGDAVDLQEVAADGLRQSGFDLVAFVPGLDAEVDAVVATLPPEKVVDLTADISRIADPRTPDRRDPYVWFDPVNVATMAGTLADAMAQTNRVEFLATQYYGVRALEVEADALSVDQRLQERLNPCRIPTLVVEAPVLGYLAKAYAFTQVPLIGWRPGQERVRALYFTLDAEPAVRSAATRAGVEVVGVDTLTQKAPNDDLLQGVSDLGDAVAGHQDCPLVVPESTDRPG